MMQDVIKRPSGEVKFTMRDKDGNIIQSFHEKNLILNGGMDAIVRLIGDGTSGKRITTIGFGTNGTTPEVTDNALTDAFTKAIGSRSYPSTGKVVIAWTLGAGEGNGKTIREMGLVCSDGTLFCRRVRDAIVKTADFSLEGTWELNF